MNTPHDVVRAYFDALSRSDLEGILGLFGTDATIMADGIETVSDAGGIRATYERAFGQVSIQEQVEIDAVTEEGNLAKVRSHSTGTVTQLQTGTPQEVGYRELFVLRRLDDEWRIADYIFNAIPA